MGKGGKAEMGMVVCVCVGGSRARQRLGFRGLRAREDEGVAGGLAG